MGEDQYVSAKEICKRFDIPRVTLYRLVERGIIPAHELPRRSFDTKRRLRFDPAEVEAALQRHQQARP
jgi:excisionase family DNA binding protein